MLIQLVVLTTVASAILVFAMLGPAPIQVAAALVQTALATTMQYQCLHATLAVATIAAVLPNAPARLAQCPALSATLVRHARYSHLVLPLCCDMLGTHLRAPVAQQCDQA